uniref:DDE Tnp4 domain-containing protein n=1 Tax=Salmo trutta TaxID=8032 RepID=A0A674BYN6_SALTR
RHHLLKQKLVAVVLLRRRHGRRWWLWVHPIKELLLDPARHHRYFRMSAEQIETLLSFVGPDLTKQTTNYRTPIEPKQRLAVTLRYLASGDSIYSLAFTYRLGFETVSQCIMETCEAIERKMLATHLPQPTVETWRQTSQEFQEKWDFPNCLGSDDGKHTKPPNSGSRFFIMKEPSLWCYSPLWMPITASQLFKWGILGETVTEKSMPTPHLEGQWHQKRCRCAKMPFCLGGEDLGKIPYTMVGDAAFPLKLYLMRPYSGHNISYETEMFNYHLCRARITVEKAFGILAARWRILYQKINLLPNVEMWLQQGGAGLRQGMRDVTIQANRAGQEAVSVREKFTKYFTSVEG